jgi:hypothetical protein
MYKFKKNPCLDSPKPKKSPKVSPKPKKSKKSKKSKKPNYYNPYYNPYEHEYKHDISPEEEVFFQKHGINTDFENLKKNYRLLQISLHPDRGGDPEEFKKLQELYDLRYKVMFYKNFKVEKF